MTERLPNRVEGDGMVLRLWENDDVHRLHQAITENLEHLRPWMAWIAFEPLTVEQRLPLLEQWKTEWEQGGGAPMVMLVDEQVVGGTGYVRREDRGGLLEIGYWVHVAHLGHGYAARAARLLTEAAFELASVEAMEIHHDQANVHSGRVPPLLGYAFIGERPDVVVAPAEVGIDCTWRVTSEAWRARGDRVTGE